MSSENSGILEKKTIKVVIRNSPIGGTELNEVVEVLPSRRGRTPKDCYRKEVTLEELQDLENSGTRIHEEVKDQMRELEKGQQ